ncbi:MAG: hypothetical protein V4501_07855 [Pseudomonadota bacterium]
MKISKLKQVFLTIICCCLISVSFAITTPQQHHHHHHKNNNIVHRQQTPTGAPPEQPPNTGNFALRVSQQPAPFIAFGENVINKNQLQAYLFGDYFRGPGQHAADALPYLVYGLTDNSSLLFALPIAASYRAGSNRSTGLEDAVFQYEYAFYTKSTTSYEDQATVVAAIYVPTGSTTANPPTGLGAPAYFLGTTFNRTYNDWLGFASPGAQITTTRNGTRFGNQYYYQFGVGHNIASVPSQWLLTFMLEADGLYSNKNRISGITDPNSGGNVIYLTPSLFYARNHLILQTGFGIPCVQQLNGSQTINNYFVAANIGWTFN